MGSDFTTTGERPAEPVCQAPEPFRQRAWYFVIAAPPLASGRLKLTFALCALGLVTCTCRGTPGAVGLGLMR